MTGLFGEEPDRSVPAGFDFDYVDLDALEQRIRVVDGGLVAGETRYRVLYLGGSSSRMTVRALRRLAELVEEGATVVGRRPVGSPSLADDDAEHARLCDRLWDGGGPSTPTTSSPALDRLGLRPALVVEGAEVLRIGRRIDGRRGDFLANPLPEPVTVTRAGRRARRLGPGDPPPDDGRSGTADRAAAARLGVPRAAGRRRSTSSARPGRRSPWTAGWRLSLPGVLETDAAGRAAALDRARPGGGRLRGRRDVRDRVELTVGRTRGRCGSATSATSRGFGSTASTAGSCGPPRGRST